MSDQAPGWRDGESPRNDDVDVGAPTDDVLDLRGVCAGGGSEKENEGAEQRRSRDLPVTALREVLHRGR